MNQNDSVGWIIGALQTVLIGVVGLCAKLFFSIQSKIADLRRDLSTLEKAQEDHDKLDDERHKETKERMDRIQREKGK